jgi:hypothetical protein
MKNLTWKSSAFNAAIEQATIIRTGRKVDYSPTSLTGKPINIRSTKTFTSTIFNPLVKNSKTHSKPTQKTLPSPPKCKTPEPGSKPVSKLRPSLKPVTHQISRPVKKIEKISDILQKSSYFKQVNFDSDSGAKTERQSPRVGEKSFVGKMQRSSTPDHCHRPVSPSTSVSFDLSSQSEIDPDALRQCLKGQQVISVESLINPITGKLSKSAKVTLKSTADLSGLVRQLEVKGFQVRQSFQTIGRKNDSPFSSHRDLSMSRNRCSTPYHLESSDDLFGNSPGVGRSRSGARTPDKAAEALYAWDCLRFPREENFTVSRMRNEPSYMKSTMSWNNKSKKLIEYLF